MTVMFYVASGNIVTTGTWHDSVVSDSWN